MGDHHSTHCLEAGRRLEGELKARQHHLQDASSSQGDLWPAWPASFCVFVDVLFHLAIVILYFFHSPALSWVVWQEMLNLLVKLQVPCHAGSCTAFCAL